MLLEILLDGKKGGLGIERIKDGLQQKNVHSTLDKTSDGRLVGLDQFVEGDVAESRILHTGRQRGRSIGRTYGPGHEAWPVVFLRRVLISGLASQLG